MNKNSLKSDSTATAIHKCTMQVATDNTQDLDTASHTGEKDVQMNRHGTHTLHTDDNMICIIIPQDNTGYTSECNMNLGSHALLNVIC